MPVALILAAALTTPTPTPPRRTFNPPVYACSAQVDPKFVTYVPPAEARGGDPLFRPVNAERDARMAGVPTDALDCLQRLQRARAQPAH